MGKNKLSSKDWDMIFYEKERLQYLENYIKDLKTRNIDEELEEIKILNKEHDIDIFKSKLNELRSIVDEYIYNHFTKDQISTLKYMIDWMEKYLGDSNI